MGYKIGQPIKWHKATWDGTLNPIAFAVCRGFTLEKKNFGKGRKLAVFLSKGNNFWLAYDLEDLEKFGKYLILLWCKKPLVFNRHKQDYYQHLADLKKYYRKIRREGLIKLSNNDLVSLYSDFFNSYTQFISWSAFCEAVAAALQPLIDKIVSGCLKKYPQDVSQSLLAPSWLSFLKKQELAELKIALKIARSNKLKKLFQRNIKPISDCLRASQNKPAQDILESLYALQRNFYWVQNNYIQAKHLNLNFFIKQIKVALGRYSFNAWKIKKEIKTIKKNTRQKKAVLHTIKLVRQDKFYVGLLDTVGFLQDTRKKAFIESIQYFDYLFFEISRRTKLKTHILKFLSPQELNLVFDIKKHNKIKSLASKRQKKSAVIFKEGKIIIEMNSQKLSKIKNWLSPKLKTVKQLEGTPASVGPKIEGVCRILYSASEVNKIKKGNILVTGNTTPDYLPAMRKAAAILTEKGGLTSHAAIISRELNVPCIVGIPDLLNAIKDRDKVGVDASRGIVRIIDRRR